MKIPGLASQTNDNNSIVPATKDDKISLLQTTNIKLCEKVMSMKSTITSLKSTNESLSNTVETLQAELQRLRLQQQQASSSTPSTAATAP